MTIICALHDPKAGCTWIGADRLVVVGHTCLPYVSKWAVYGGWAIGGTGNLRTTNLFHAHAKRLLDDLDAAFDYSNRLKDVLVEDGFNHDTEEGPKSYGQTTILAHGSGVWAVGPSFEIIEIPPGQLWAEGAGMKYALGAAHALQSSSAETIISTAVGAAIRYSDSCGGEAWLDKLE